MTGASQTPPDGKCNGIAFPAYPVDGLCKALALDAATGEKLWGFKLGGGIRSQPVAYQAGGETFVVIASGNFGFIAGAVGGDTRIPEGGHLFVFKLRQDD